MNKAEGKLSEETANSSASLEDATIIAKVDTDILTEPILKTLMT